MSPRRKPKTAGELMAELEQDPEYLERVRQKKAELEEVRRRRDKEQRPVMVDLAKVGYKFDSLSDLCNSGLVYREAVPVLLDWFPRMSDPWIKQWIVRALSVPWAKPEAIRPMFDAFRQPDELYSVRWVIGAALWSIADDSDYDELVELACDRKFGTARSMIVLRLGKFKKRPEVVDVLLSLVDDPDVGGIAVQALSKLKAPAARSVFEAKLNDSSAEVRKDARNGLAKLDAKKL